jgi:hypothetical protein
MNFSKGFQLGSLLGIGIGAIILLMRHAPLRDAQITEIQPTVPPQARLMLRYGFGTRPQSVVIDVATTAGQGSTTIPGTQEFASIPLGGAAKDPKLTVTLFYRFLGGLQVKEREIIKA